MSSRARILALGAVSVVAALIAYDHFEFGSDRRQREILSTYLPEAKCNDASFDLVERQDGISDWGYVVRISNSRQCIESLRGALAMRGAKASDPNSATQGLILPGHTDLENELVAFDFNSQSGSAIWTRSKT